MIIENSYVLYIKLQPYFILIGCIISSLRRVFVRLLCFAGSYGSTETEFFMDRCVGMLMTSVGSWKAGWRIGQQQRWLLRRCPLLQQRGGFVGKLQLVAG
ncbi:hypothetical protein M5689_013573 [Euphorbia peplus]|nr:hypothetical protein M5689_013573 [Euphorbia peplus]